MPGSLSDFSAHSKIAMRTGAHEMKYRSTATFHFTPSLLPLNLKFSCCVIFTSNIGLFS